jgi:hypothetical protein
MLTPEERTCFAITNIQILTPEELRSSNLGYSGAIAFVGLGFPHLPNLLHLGTSPRLV